MSLYKQPGSSNWIANIKVPGHARLRRSTGTEDRVEAQKIHDTWRAELWALKPTSDEGLGHSWSQAIELWLDQEERSESELLSLHKLGTKYLDRPLSEVSAESIEEALSFCRTAGTYTRYRTMVVAILNLAKSKRWLTEIPILAQRKDKKKKPRKWITREQWARLYQELPAHMQPMAEFAIETGLRQANVLGLTWDRVDLERGLVWMEAQDMKDDDALPVPLSDRAQAALAAVRGQHDVWVFTYRGKPVKEIKTAFQAACQRAGLGRHVQVDGRPRWEGFTWHGLRHTWATWHVQDETPLDVLQALGGWSDMRMVQNYSHHTAGRLSRYVRERGRSGQTGDREADG